MDAPVLISIYIPIFVLLFIILPSQRQQALKALKNKRRKGGIIMTNEVIKKYIGKRCIVSTGTFGVNAVGIIRDVKENWIELETKKGNELINAEFVQNIKIK